MNPYIRDRVRADAAHAVERAKNEARIKHRGLRGRFRELLVDTLISPWLPPYAACGTGTILDHTGKDVLGSSRRSGHSENDGIERESTQEDIVIFDRSLIPCVLASPSAQEGAYPLEGVLARIEVKSKLTKVELRRAVQAAAEVASLTMATPAPQSTPPTWPFNCIFAFDTDLQIGGKDELSRLVDVIAELGVSAQDAGGRAVPVIPALCVAGRGCWTWGGLPGRQPAWLRAKITSPHDELIHFIGTLSNSCFRLHMERQGRTYGIGVECGIGPYVISAETFEPAT
jgi:hypothetical protein